VRQLGRAMTLLTQCRASRSLDRKDPANMNSELETSCLIDAPRSYVHCRTCAGGVVASMTIVLAGVQRVEEGLEARAVPGVA